MDYSSLIRQAWEITRRYRFLWVLGLFTGGGVASCNPGSSLSYRGNERDFGQVSPDVGRAMAEIGNWFEANFAVVVAVVGFLVLLGLAMLVVGIVAQGGMARATADLALGRPTSAGEAWRAGLRLFWRYLGLWLLLIAAAIAVAVIIGIVAAVFVGLGSLTGRAGGLVLAALGVLLAIAVAVVAIPFFIALGIVVTYAQRAMALEDVGPVDGLRAGYQVLRGHLGPSLVVWLISLAIGIGAGIALALVVIVVVAVLAAVGLAIYATGGFAAPVVIVTYGALALLVVVVVSWGLSAVANTYFWTYWTIAYLRLTGRLEAAA